MVQSNYTEAEVLRFIERAREVDAVQEVLHLESRQDKSKRNRYNST
jgi:hypothetical protein